VTVGSAARCSAAAAGRRQRPHRRSQPLCGKRFPAERLLIIPDYYADALREAAMQMAAPVVSSMGAWGADCRNSKLLLLPRQSWGISLVIRCIRNNPFSPPFVDAIKFTPAVRTSDKPLLCVDLRHKTRAVGFPLCKSDKSRTKRYLKTMLSLGPPDRLPYQKSHRY
jgi:hypothetical protein